MRKATIIRILVVLLCCAMFSSAHAIDFDFSAMSIAELQEIISAARKELSIKTAEQDERIILVNDPDGILVYLTGKGEKNNWYNQYDLEAIFENSTDNPASISFENVSINDWEVYEWGSELTEVGSTKKKKGRLILSLDDADITSVSEVEEVEFIVRYYDPSSYTTIKEYGPIILYFDGSNWSKK